jgi:hypothetical protein
MLQGIMSTQASFDAFSEIALVEEVERLARGERRATARLVAALTEFDAHKLYLGQGCSSMFVYCTRVLHLSEHAAYGRIEAARAARRYPVILGMLEAGELTLTSVGLLATHLTPQNHSAVLERAKGRTKREVQEIVASLRPLPDAKPLVRKQPAVLSPEDIENVPGPQGRASATSSASDAPVQATSDRPDAADSHAKQAAARSVGRETIAKLRRVQDLMRHVTPNGDLEVIFHRAIQMLLEDLEKKRIAAASRPRQGTSPNAKGRHIPAAVRRAVWRRDEGRCAFTGSSGRCNETGFLEFHHIRPFAAGGETTEENIELRCRAHNQYEADLFFGPLTARERADGEFGANSVRTEFGQ